MTGKPVIGFVGVGLMGWGMAKNVVEKGWPLRVVAHRKREAVDDLVKRGAREVATLAEMAEAAETVVLCVTGAPQVEGCVAELTRDGSRVRTIIDTSTSEPDLTHRLAAELAKKDVELIDAPMSKTPAHTWEGDATTYVGGPPERVEAHRELLSTWASKIIPTGGPVGSAHAVKLVNNSVAIGYAAIWAEAFATLRKLGLEARVLHEIISNSGMTCANFQNFAKYPVEGVPDAHKFTLINCLKDISYYGRLADGAGAATPMAAAATELLKVGCNLGMGERYMAQFLDISLALNGEAAPRPSPDEGDASGA